jgi:small subunit ribosomal protein S17
VTDEPDTTDHEPTSDAASGQVEPEAAAPAPEADPEQAAPESPADEAPADGADEAAPGGPSAAEPAAEAEPAEVLSSKERRRRARSTHTGNHNPSRTPEDRHAERLEERKRKATRRRARRAQERAKAAQRRASAPASGPDASAAGASGPETSSVDGLPARARGGGAQRVRQGIVVSDKPNKTITVRIDVARRHRRYEKIVRSSSTFHVHDENNDAHEGDTVRVIESRPLSRTKRWKLVEVLERAR